MNNYNNKTQFPVVDPLTGEYMMLLKTKKQFNAPDKYEKTYLYRLTKQFVFRLNCIYRVLGKMNAIRMDQQPVLSPLPPEAKQMIQDMNDKIQDIQMGRKPQDLIK